MKRLGIATCVPANPRYHPGRRLPCRHPRVASHSRPRRAAAGVAPRPERTAPIRRPGHDHEIVRQTQVWRNRDTMRRRLARRRLQLGLICFLSSSSSLSLRPLRIGSKPCSRGVVNIPWCAPGSFALKNGWPARVQNPQPLRGSGIEGGTRPLGPLNQASDPTFLTIRRCSSPLPPTLGPSAGLYSWGPDMKWPVKPT